MENKKIETDIALRVLYYALKVYFNGYLNFKPDDVVKIYVEHADEEKMTIEKCSMYLEYLWKNSFFSKVETEDDKFLRYNFENARINYLR